MARETQGLTIGTLATRSGCTVPTIRYYESIGLLPPAARRDSGHRVYDAAAVGRLRYIRRCRDAGFGLNDVRELVALSSSTERDCKQTLQITQTRLQAIRRQMAALRLLEQELSRCTQACATSCAGGPAAQCSLVTDLLRPDAP